MPERLLALRAIDPSARRSTLAAVDPDDDSSAPDLIYEALGDDDFAVRQEGIRLALRCRDPAAVLAVLERALCDESSLARRSSAMEAFGKLGAAAVPALGKLVEDARPGIRRLAIDALGQTRAPEAYDALHLGANDPSPAVRSASLEALSRIGDERSIRRIEEGIARRDEVPTVILAGLLGLDALERVLPKGRLRPHLADPLTAAPTLRLLGRAGDATPLLEVLARGRGVRQRAAAAGLAHALVAAPELTRAAILASRDTVEAPLLDLCANAEVSTASAALLVAAVARLPAAFEAVASRPDRGVLVTASHRAAALFAAQDPGAGLRLKELAGRQNDPAAAAFLDEVSGGLRAEARPAASGSEPSTPAAPPSLSAFAVDRPSLGAEDFAQLAGLFHREAGLMFEDHAAWRLEARLAPRLKSRALSTWREYVALLESDTPDGATELAAALERVTVHETYFFRERYQLESFVGEVLPAMLGQRPGALPPVRRRHDGTLRVLSAGCSTGEEAWTLAILLAETGWFRAGLDYEVVGLDIAPSIIEAARQGRYGRRGFRGDVPPTVMERWFREEGKTHVVTGLEDRVRFDVGNLLDPADLSRAGHFDVIFCRNVLIYMSDEARTRVINHFFERLLPGGVLFLGHSESLLNIQSGFRFLPLERELAYLKPMNGSGRSV